MNGFGVQFQNIYHYTLEKKLLVNFFLFCLHFTLGIIVLNLPTQEKNYILSREYARVNNVENEINKMFI